ncbi:hypothetical protein FSARC_2483 [Fusarium sarcochroum]|uniref:Ankyrin repeat protein n=1 Tax=Fusarium sarcochroum TaxID=1208366 RepID=A0A8H4U629_9HYPO|nr:hypothetical protein FSARC_2483 [Fusarium sarcochroum]
METGASIVAFVQVAGEIAKFIIKVNQLWCEAKDLPHDLQDMLDELNDYAPVFEELKEQLEYDQAVNSGRSNSYVTRSFSASLEAHKILKDIVEELSFKIQSRKEGLQRTMSAFRLLTKKDKLERHQKRLKRSIRLLHTAISTYQINLRRQLAGFQPRLAPMVQMIGHGEQKLSDEQNDIKLLSTATALDNDSQLKPTASQKKRIGLTYTKEPKFWRASVQFPSWLSQAVYEFQSNTTLWCWNFTYRTYNIISPESEIIQTIQKGDKNGVLELFDTRRASPYDKDHRGYSLLYFAAQNKQYEICQALLKLGLKASLTEVVGEARESPLKPLVYQPKRGTPEDEWARIVELFQVYLQDVDEVSVVRLFDFIHEWAYGDEFMFIFKDRFMPKYYHWPLRDRLEAVRLGSFHVQTYSSLPRLLSKDSVITGSDVSQSSDEKLSLLHSAAVALAIRFADETLPYKRAEFQWRVYNESWRELVTNIASVAKPEDLHSIELVSPWDVHHVPHWRGTPLISVIGGALCYLSPDVSFVHWDNSIQQTMHEWLEGLRLSGVDLLKYGKREYSLLHEGLKGALDANAIEASRTMIRENLARAAYGGKVSQTADEGWNVNHWVPIRIIDLAIGPKVENWRIIWAPEFEYMACQFWDLVEGADEKSVMPGSWSED